jgi:excisionase family DNA binding protein
MDDVAADDEIDLLTIHEVAELMRVSTKTVERLVYSGKPPVLKVNRRTIRFQRRDVVAFVNANTRFLSRDCAVRATDLRLSEMQRGRRARVRLGAPRRKPKRRRQRDQG